MKNGTSPFHGTWAWKETWTVTHKRCDNSYNKINNVHNEKQTNRKKKKTSYNAPKFKLKEMPAP